MRIQAPVSLSLAFISALALVAADRPAFEVASIRAASPVTLQMVMAGKANVGIKVNGDRVDIGYQTLKDLIPVAYGVKAFQVTVPSSISATRYNIVAKLPSGATKEQVPALLRTLLEDRFQLKLHREKKPQPVYSLAVAKGGTKLKPSPAKPIAPLPDAIVIGEGDNEIRMSHGAGGMAMTGRNGTLRMSAGAHGSIRFAMEQSTMTDVAELLTPMLDRTVVDHTRLKGTYELALDISMEDAIDALRASGSALPDIMGHGPTPKTDPNTAADPAGGTIFAGLQELGLRLDPRREAIEMIVVDQAKQPTEN